MRYRAATVRKRLLPQAARLGPAGLTDDDSHGPGAALTTAVQKAVEGLTDTAKLPVPAAELKLADEAVRENCGAAPACVTANEDPAIAMAPDRVVAARLAARE